MFRCLIQEPCVGPIIRAVGKAKTPETRLQSTDGGHTEGEDRGRAIIKPCSERRGVFIRVVRRPATNFRRRRPEKLFLAGALLETLNTGSPSALSCCAKAWVLNFNKSLRITAMEAQLDRLPQIAMVGTQHAHIYDSVLHGSLHESLLSLRPLSKSLPDSFASPPHGDQTPIRSCLIVVSLAIQTRTQNIRYRGPQSQCGAVNSAR